MAALMIARLACDALRGRGPAGKQREARAVAAKAWLASIAVPARARPVLLQAVDATARDGAAIASAIDEVVKVAGTWLDEASIGELRAVTAAPFVNSR